MTGPEFRTARKALGFKSRVSLGAALDKSPDTIQRWEDDKGDLAVVELARRLFKLGLLDYND